MPRNTDVQAAWLCMTKTGTITCILCITPQGLEDCAEPTRLNSLFLGHMPIAVPRSFLAAERHFCLISNCAAYIQICGIGHPHLVRVSA